MNTDYVSDFYDEFVNEQAASGINERIFSLFKRTKKLGLKSNSNVLELGCGIGTFTFLLSKIVKQGIIEAVDISPLSIMYAKGKLKKQNIKFITSNILNYTPEHNNYSFIVLFDIIEHIHLHKHDVFFGNIQNYMNDYTLLLINIPNPKYTEYDRLHQSHLLQIIDETVYLNDLSAVLYKNNLYIHFFETYSIWAKDDYQFIVVRKNHPFEEIKLSSLQGYGKKIKERLKREYIKKIYKF